MSSLAADLASGSALLGDVRVAGVSAEWLEDLAVLGLWKEIFSKGGGIRLTDGVQTGSIGHGQEGEDDEEDEDDLEDMY